MTEISWEPDETGSLAPVTYDEDGNKVYPAWAPLPGSQTAFLNCPVFEVLYTGSRGPGKTDALLMDFAQHVGQGFGSDWRGIIFRQTYPQLQDLIAKSKKWFTRIFPDAKYNEAKSKWIWPTGEELLLRHMKSPQDYYSYHGHAYPFIGWEELTTWPTPHCYTMMFSCSRSARQGMPRKVRATTNPYGCVPYGDVLTEDGWKPIESVQVGERVVSVSKDGTSRLARVNAVVAKEYDGEMVLRDGVGISMAFTPDHRFAHLNTDRTDFTIKHYHELPGQAVLKRTGDGWSGESPEDIMGFDPGDFMEFLGWFLSEGCVVRRHGEFEGHALSIAQMKPDNRKRIHDLLERMGVRFRSDDKSFTVTNQALHGALCQQGRSYEKFVPRWAMNLDQPLLERLFESLMLGDGTADRVYYTQSPQLADDVAEIATKTGRSVYTSSRHRADRERPCFEVNCNHRKTVQLHTGHHVYDVSTTCKALNVEKERYQGMVYCLNVPETETFFIRQNGTVWLSGNSGHSWVKKRFRLPVGKNRITGPLITDDGPPRMAIQGYLQENQVLLSADPSYIQRLRASARNESEKAAWLYGSWDITSGGMFDDLWQSSTHVVTGFPLELLKNSGWRVDRSFDWGSSRPFSVGWWAESNGEPISWKGKQYGTVPGDLYRIREWYGTNGRPNEGLKMLAEDVAIGIRERQIEWGIDGMTRAGPADRSIFDLENGRSVAVDMRKQGVRWEEADKRPGSRKQGWEQMRRLLAGAVPPETGTPRENPGLFVFDCCHDFIELIPVAPRSERDLDDIDTDSEDHIADEARYRIRRKPREVHQRAF